MKTRLFILLITCFFLFSAAALGTREKKDDARSREVVVYAYDSFTADWGPGPELVKLFEEKTGMKVTLISVGDTGLLLSRAVLEKKNPQADVLVGISNQLLDTAKAHDVLESYTPEGARQIIPDGLLFDSEWFLTPYDWSYFAMIYDSLSGVPAPAALSDLLKPEYEKKIILMDPRTSAVGLGFVAWTVAVFGDRYTDFWNALKPNILTMAPGWDTGYGLFTSGEAPLVVSYTTSPPYHVEYDGTDRYKALIFPEGHTMHIEGAGVVKGAKNPEGARAFMDFLISEEAQAVLPQTQWMYPVNEDVPLPPSYDTAPKAGKMLYVDTAQLSAAVDEVMTLLSR